MNADDMNNQRPTEDEIFRIAYELASPDARIAYLKQVCRDDLEVERIIALLKEGGPDESFLENGPTDLAETMDHSTRMDMTGQSIGAYKLLQQIGEGGFGNVYLAEQTAPVRRKVALKVIKPGMDTKQVVARFEAERQALALMDHPNVARVFDGGSTETGRPYFVMELVKGVPITTFCDENKLDVRRRLELFRDVCRAVQHAHMKGIIHRDLKPSNVLVAEFDHEPVTKIIDFGVAKAINQELTDKTMYTQFGQIIGTLDYMSPEQAKFNQLDIDVRSDVYSLGVLLYELLAGETPIEKNRLQESGLEEVLRIIREDEPPRPSTRVESSATLPATAEKRRIEPAKLAGVLKEDLDWIVVKAMAKERNERYQSAEDLATEIDRHLNDLPIQARRPSLIGRVRKFARRRKSTFAAIVAVAAVSLVAAGFAFVAYLERIDKNQKQTELTATRIEAERVKAEADRQTWAREALVQVGKLTDEQEIVRAFQLATRVQEILADDPEFETLWEQISIVPKQTFEVQPEGTTIQYREATDPQGQWFVAGKSPLSGTAFPSGPLRFRLAKQGFITREFQRPFPDFLKHEGVIKLDPISKSREGMTCVSAVTTANWNQLRADLHPYHIDRYEVSNREYQEFVDRGGYENPDFWSHLEFVEDSKSEPLSWEKAVGEFIDATGMPGPATWTDGRFPKGRGDYPVSGIRWFEAMAYAAFVGKSLPTIDHWTWASRIERHDYQLLAKLSNFSRRGTTPRGAHDGIGRFEVYDMAGNVREWVHTQDTSGNRFIMGACWDDPDYLLFSTVSISPWDRDPRNGFRCVEYGKDAPEKPTLAAIDTRWDNDDFKLPPRVPIEPLIAKHEYDREYPLEPRIIQTDAEEQSSLYRHEIVEINASYDDQRFHVHLLIPRNPKDAFETVVWFPGMDQFSQTKVARDFPHKKRGVGAGVKGLLQAGRIVCRPEYDGTLRRFRDEPYFRRFRTKPIQARNDWMHVFVDLRRTVDYLVTRDDVDSDRLLYYGTSWGAMSGPISLVLEPRFQVAILLSGGYFKAERYHFPEIAASQFAPHVQQPVLMINGLNDNIFPPRLSQRVMFEDLPNPLNQHTLLDVEHGVPGEQVTPILEPWLEKVWAAMEEGNDDAAAE